MITTKTKKRIFLKTASADLSPRVLSKRKVQTVQKISSFEFDRTYDMLTVEIACLIDQRVLLEEKISDIKVYLSNRSLEELKSRTNTIQEAKNPRINRIGENSLFNRSRSNLKARRESSKDRTERQIQERDSSGTIPSRVTRTNILNAVYDIDNINQNLSIERFKSLKFLTKFNVNQILGPLRIKNIQGVSQTDEDLFGRRSVFEVRRSTMPKFRKLSNRSRGVSIDALTPPSDDLEIPSVLNFRRSYFQEIKMGRDPMISFNQRDVEVTLEDKIRGSKKIQKPKTSKLRSQFKKIVNEKLILSPDEDLGFKIAKKKISNRNRICKTTFEMSRTKIKSLSQRPGGFNLIFFAFDENGRRVDSFEQKLSATSLFETEKNPTIDFDLNCVRTARGNIVTKVRNQELQDTYFGFYQKSFSKSQNYMNSIFDSNEEKIFIKSNNTAMLVDGKEQTGKTRLFSNSKTVFQRVNPYFDDEEISNSAAASAASTVSDAQQLSCALIVIQEAEEKTATVTISNLSEDVFAILPVKRIAKGTRGSDFSPLVEFVDGQFTKVKKVFVRDEDINNEKGPSFSFTDADVEDDVIYEYAVMLYNRSGYSHVSGNRFLEKRIDREGLINLEVQKNHTGNTSFDDNSGQVVSTVNFEVTLNRQEDDVDKIINSIFGDNRSLFNDDLSSIKDASNLIYGVRVHRINTDTGEYVFVGSFRGYKQEDANATAQTDIPKTYRVTFSDNAPAFSSHIYKFDPYVIPPSQVLDKVLVSLENMIKNKNRSRSTLNRMLVSKQKILNRQTITKVATKYANVRGSRGAVSSTESFLEKNKNDLFLEGTTGDLLYDTLEPINIRAITSKTSVTNKTINLIKTLDRDTRSKNYIPKKIARIQFSVNSSDVLMDFYVVVKQFNKDQDFTIDGVIHSKDVPERNEKEETDYNYLSEVRTSVGLVRYYLFGITKNCMVSGPEILGSLMLEGE